MPSLPKVSAACSPSCGGAFALAFALEQQRRIWFPCAAFFRAGFSDGTDGTRVGSQAFFQMSGRMALIRYQQKPAGQYRTGKVDKMNTFSKIAGATALAATMLTGTLGSSWAGAVPTNVGTVKSTPDAGVVPVRWGHRGWWGPGAIIGGVAAGLAGAAVAEGVYGPYAYGPYPYGAYDYDYYPGPYYYGPHWRYHHHW
jgi:hypothetical protein